MGNILEVAGVEKNYPGVVANRDVSLLVREGSIHAIIGENGAGKSTLMKTLYGLIRPDAGSIKAFGKEVFLIEGDYQNLKITRPIDLLIAEQILAERSR